MSEVSYLSDKARIALRIAGIPATIDIRICSRCGLSSMEVPKEKKHPCESLHMQAARELYKNRGNPILIKQERMLRDKIHNFSRCCGRDYRFKRVDNHLGLWQTWKNRFNLLVEPIQAIRQKYYGGSMDHSDDFLALSTVLGTSDHNVRSVIRIFTAEEARQKLAASQEQQNQSSQLQVAV